MRKPSPFPYLTPTLFALAVSAAQAAAPVVSAAPAPASPAPVVTAPAPSSSNSTATFSNAAPTSSAASTPGASNSGMALRNQSTSQTNQSAIGPTTDAASFGPDSPFVNNPNPEVGLSPGQTSTGIAAGNEPSGLENSTTTGTFTQSTNGIATPAGAVGTIVPMDVLGGGGGYAGGGRTAMGGTAVAISPRLPASSGSATPLLDQATRNAALREERRRASGNPPRIIGIAPRTDADRTDEMPDDPIIRY